MTTPHADDLVGHIVEAAEDALRFVADLDRSSFESDKRTQQAVVFNLMIVGEAAARLMDHHPEFVARRPDVPWRSMRGMRNRIAHGYFDINLDTVWETVQEALPVLLNLLRERN